MEILFSGQQLEYKTTYSSGADLVSSEDKVIECGNTDVVKTGLFIASCTIEENSPFVPEIQIRPRSGLSRKGILIHLGTVDADYRQEIGVIITNLAAEDYVIKKGDRIAQIICAIAYRSPSFIVRNEERKGGFGSTGK